MSKKPVAIVLVLAVLLIGGTVYKNYFSAAPLKDVIQASGTVESTEIDVASEVGGKLTELNVTEGQQVKVGGLLAKIDATVFDLQAKQNEAVLRSAQAKARETKAGSRQEMIGQAKASVQQVNALVNGAKTALTNAETNYNRIKGMYQSGGATQQQLDSAEAQLQSARAQYEAQVSQLNAAKQQLNLLQNGATVETINAADAGVAQAQAALEIAKAQQLKTIITSPKEGVVSSVNFEKGEMVTTGASILTLTDPQDMWVQVYIPEQDIPNIKVGQEALIYIDAYPDKGFKGVVSYISPKAEFTPKNVQTKEERVKTVFGVKIRITQDVDKFKPGLPADIEIKK